LSELEAPGDQVMTCLPGASNVIGQGDNFVSASQNEFAWMQDKCFAIFGDDFTSKFGLFDRWINH